LRLLVSGRQRRLDRLKDREHRLFFLKRDRIDPVDVRVDRLRRLTPSAIEYGRRRAYAAGGAFGSFMTCLSVSTASRVNPRAAAFTSATILPASMVSGRLGRPSGFPEMPGLKLVDLRRPFGVVWFRPVPRRAGIAATLMRRKRRQWRGWQRDV
jgi:hypothetical protein